MPGLNPTLRPVLCLALALACGGANLPPRDGGEIEILRIRITKARHAISETREAITMSQGAPYLPELYARLAELLSEEARYHYRLAAARSPEARPEALHVPQVRLLKERAIGTYELILRRFPNASLNDRVLFSLAFEHRELGSHDEMVAALQRLVDEHPDSSYRAQGAILLGDHLADSGDADGAERAYASVTAGDPSHAAALAHYRIGWLYVQRESCGPALREFVAAIETSDAAGPVDPEEQSVLGEALDVRRSALLDMVYCYTQERPGRDALTDFRGWANDRASYVAVLSKLARRYALVDDADTTLAVLRELLRLAPADEERLDDARAMHTALRAARRWDRIDTDVAAMLGTLETYLQRVSVEAETRDRLREEFEVYARDLLTRAQDAVARRDEDERAVAARTVAGGYERYLALFPRSEHRNDMRMNLAAMLADAGEPLEAGLRLAEAAEELEGDAQRDALYDAVGRFSEALERADDEARYGDRNIAPSALRHAAARLLRHELEPDRQRRVRFALAESYYDQGRYREAIDRLTALAYEFPGTDEATAAARLVLDSFNTMDDAFGLMHAGQRFLADGSPVPELRGELEPLVAAAEQRMIDEVSLEQAGDDGGDAGRLLELAREHRGTPLGERAAMNAFLAARATGDTEQMYTLGAEIAEGYPSSEQLPGVLSTLGQTAVGRFEVDRALEMLARAADAGHERAAALRVAAGRLYESVGRHDRAIAAYEAAIRDGGAPAQEAMIALASILEQQGDADGIVARFGANVADAPPEVAARVGLAQVARGELETAEPIFQQVLATGSSAESLARAHLGMGALLQGALAQLGELQGIEAIEELLAIVDLAQSSYVESVRQGDPAVAALALGRLGALAETAASVLRRVSLDGLDANVRAQLERGLRRRADAYAQTTTEARTQCAARAWESQIFTPAVRACLRGELPSAVLATGDLPRGGQTGRQAPEVAELRARVAQNPEDLDALRALADGLLAAHDPHTARLVLQAIAERGARPEDLEKLGVACARVGDHAGSLRAFARAAAAGSASAKQQLAASLESLGLRDAAREAERRFETNPNERRVAAREAR
jgi:tetratricopeptide (TPR) repeat protein